MRRARRLVVLVALLAGVVVVPTQQAGAAPPLPDSIAAIGDSITRAFDVCCFYGERPQHSWTTGNSSSDVVNSHYERIRAANPGIGDNRFNDARSGARMDDAPGQAQQVVSHGAEYVTILMGANDVCTSSIGSMTPVAEFEADFRETMTILTSNLPEVRVFVSSIPDIHQLWEVLHRNPLARLVWAIAGICQSMLAESNDEADRQRVLAHEVELNRVLARVCAQFAANCRFDNFATFNFQFSAGMVSGLDFFHPDRSGQAALAEVTWRASYWGAAA